MESLAQRSSPYIYQMDNPIPSSLEAWGRPGLSAEKEMEKKGVRDQLRQSPDSVWPCNVPSPLESSGGSRRQWEK